jgi:hypothetical protein
VEQALAHYRVATPARFEPQADAVLALPGAEAGAVLARAGAENPPIEPEAAALRAAGAAAATVESLDVQRIEAGRP